MVENEDSEVAEQQERQNAHRKLLAARIPILMLRYAYYVETSMFACPHSFVLCFFCPNSRAERARAHA